VGFLARLAEKRSSSRTATSTGKSSMPWPLLNQKNQKGRARMGCGLLVLDESAG